MILMNHDWSVSPSQAYQRVYESPTGVPRHGGNRMDSVGLLV